jgi:hypothetical protein
MKITTLLLLSAATVAVAQTIALSTQPAVSPTPQSATPAPPISSTAAAHGEIYPLPHALRIVLAGDSTVNHTTGWGTAVCAKILETGTNASRARTIRTIINHASKKQTVG